MDLFDAIEAENLEALNRLVADGADVNDNDFDDRQSTPLETACERGNEAIVVALLEAGAKPSGGVFQSPLVPAAAFGFASIVERLLAAGADPDGCDEEGATALALAATFGFRDIARVLVEAGADPTRCDNDGLSPIDAARQNRHEELAEYLQDPTAFADGHDYWRDAGKRSRKARNKQRKDLARPEELPDPERDASGYAKGFAVTRCGEVTTTQDFSSVCSSGEVDVVKDMLDAGLAVDWRFVGAGPTGLLSAARRGRLEVIDLLIERGADVNFRDEQGQTALHYALMDPSAPKHGDVVRRLIDAGCDPSRAGDQGRNLLRMAERWKAAEIVEMLRDAGASG